MALSMRTAQVGPTIASEVDRYIASWAAGSDTPEFVSMHMRRTDFKMAHKGTYADTAEVGTALAGLAKTHGVKHMFVATDSTDGELNEIQQRLKADAVELHRYKPGHYGTPLINYGSATGQLKLALVEQIIASRGKFFVGTVKSHFSKEIHMERRARQGGGEAFYENSMSMSKGGKLVQLCRSWQSNEGECEIGPLD